MRITTSVIMFYLWISASAAAVEAIGLAENMGVTAPMGVDTGLERAVDGLDAVRGGGISAESLVGLYTIGSGAVQTFVGGLTAGPRLMAAAGVPVEFVIFLSAPIPLLAGRLIIYSVTGRDL